MKRILICAFILLGLSQSYAQKNNLSKSFSFDEKESGIIKEDHMVNGFYSIAEAKVAGSKKKQMSVIIMDPYLETLKELNIDVPKSFLYYDCIFNTTSFCLAFKKSSAEYLFEVYDFDGNKLNRKSSWELNKFEYGNVDQGYHVHQTRSVPGAGYIQIKPYTPKGPKAGFLIRYLPLNPDEEGFKIREHNKDEKLIYYLRNVNESYLAGIELSWVNVAAPFSNERVTVRSMQSGKVVYEMPVKDNHLVSEVKILSDNALFVIQENINTSKERNIKNEDRNGIEFTILDSTGTIQNEKVLPDDEIIELVTKKPAIQDKHEKDMVKFHQWFENDDGHLIGVGEIGLYYNSSYLVTSGPRKHKEFFICKLNRSLDLEVLHVIDHYATTIVKPELTNIGDYAGEYRFSQKDTESNLYSFSFYDSKGGAFNSYVFDENKIYEDIMPVTAKAKSIGFLPSTFGNFIMLESTKKSKTPTISVKKINY